MTRSTPKSPSSRLLSLAEIKLAKLQQLRDLQAEVDRREVERNRNRDVFEVLGFTPNPGPQQRFLDLPDENMDVLYGGAGGGGKSHSLLMLALRTCVRWPGIQVFWFRRSFPELNQSVLRMLARYGYAKDLSARWDGSKYELRFPGGAVLTFSHAKNLKEASALQSAEINLLLLDERTTIPPDVVDFLYTRVRSGVPGVPCLGIRSASNPGNVGHGRVKRAFIEPTEYGTKEITDAAGRRRLFIPAKVSDNPFVGEYEATLDGIEDPDLRRMIKEGDWSVMPNQAFPDWRHARIVIPPLELPLSWSRYQGLDYGWTAPSVALWAARDNDGRLWFYRELTMRQTPEREQARRILAAEQPGEQVVARPADPSMWGKAGSALPPASQFAIEGCALVQADNDRLGGKGRVHTYLSEAPACAYHRAQGWDTCPMLHVLDGTCPEMVRTIPDLPRDEKRPEDVDTNADDHWYDAARYLVMAVGGAVRFHFPDDTTAPVTTVDPNAAGPTPADTELPRMIGGFPVLEGGTPWG